MEIPIPQDIRKYKTKDVGNFSFLEAGYIALGCGLGFLTYKFTSSLETAFVPLAIVLVFGFLKPFGLTFSQFLRTFVKEQLSPKTLIWETDFEYDADEFDKLYGEHICVSSEWSVIQTDSAVNNKSKENKLDNALIIR